MNTTKRPSAEMLSRSSPLDMSAWLPSSALETRPVVFVYRFRTKTSIEWLVSPGTRFEALDEYATILPSADTTGTEMPPLSPLPWCSLEETDIRLVRPV